MTRSTILTSGALILAIGSLAGCSGNPQPQALPPQTMAPKPPETPELSNITEADRTAAGGAPETTAGSMPVVEPVGPVAASTVTEPSIEAGTRIVEPVSPEDDPLTVMVDPGTDPSEERPLSIFEAAQAEKERRRAVGESTIVLTNETLKEYSKGQITFVEDDGEPAEAESAEESILEESDPSSEQDELNEDHWRNRVRDLRLAWRDAYDSIEDYQLEIARLRREFYAEDDPFYRDSQIKPAWDQALEDLDEAERTVTRSQRELEHAIDEGRRAGALPGWLREGIEYEPELEEEDDFGRPRDDRVHEASEPVIVDDDGGG